MNHLTYKRVVLLFSFILLLTQNTYSQDEYNKWVIGVGVNAIDYFPASGIDNGNSEGFFNEIANAKDHWNIGGPKINVTRYWKHKISFDASFSMNNISKVGDRAVESVKYYAIDGNVQYSILKPENRFSPYILAGGGYTFAFKSGGTVNAGIGANYWFSDVLGVNAQGMYKYNSPDFSLFPHMYYSFSIVYKLSAQRKGSWFGNSKKCFQ